MVLVRAAGEVDLPGILAIYNHEVAHTTAIWNDAPVELAERRSWYEARRARSYPVLVADMDGQIAGYASFGDFRLFDGYRFTVEHSVYVAERARRQGIATKLVQRLLEEARLQAKHVMLGGIASDNAASLALHERLGFVESARMREVGYKFGRWLDLIFMQKIL